MIKKICVLLITITLLSCKKQDIPKSFDEITRETSTKDFFFKNVLEKDKNIYNVNEIDYNAVEMFEKFKHTNSTIQDTIFTYNDKIIGQVYAIERYVENDTSFKFDNLKFNRFIIFSDNYDKTFGFKLFGDSQNSNAVINFIHKYNLQNADELSSIFKKYEFKDENINDLTNKLRNCFKTKLKDKTIFLKISDISTAIPEPFPTENSKNPEKNNSNKTIVKYTGPIELTIIFNSLDFEQEKYLRENNYIR